VVPRQREEFGCHWRLVRQCSWVPAGSGWADSGTDYYRYWLDGDNHGFKHGLKFVVKPSTYVKLQATGYDPRTASNATLSMFADYYYEYDDEDRVVLERIGAGSRTFTFRDSSPQTSIRRVALDWSARRGPGAGRRGRIGVASSCASGMARVSFRDWA
jgi:hypothetical protein